MVRQSVMKYSGLILGLALPFHAANADGIVTSVVNSPLSASGLVRDARVGINVWLQSEAAPGLEFMDPNVTGLILGTVYLFKPPCGQVDGSGYLELTSYNPEILSRNYFR